MSKEEFLGPSPRDIKPPAESDSWQEMLKWKHTSRGRILEPNSLINTIVLLQHAAAFKGVFILNEFSDEIMVMRCPPWEDERKFKIRRLDHNDIVQCSAALEYKGLNSSIERTVNAIGVAAHKNAIHPMRDYFEKMEWDGEDRLGTWLLDYAGAKHNGQPEEYVVAVGMKWMVAAVKRIYEPGSKFDHMLVLEGKQNVGKSSLFRTLATIGPKEGETGDEVEFFTDGIKFSNIGEPSSIMALQGKLIIEFSELAGMSRKEIEEVKGWITIQRDEVQKKYKNEITQYPRQFVLAGTTNEDAWLRDHTGNRRFLPIKCAGRLDIKGLKEVREQLWAEAVYRYKDGFETWIDYGSELEVLAGEQQSARLVDDVWTDTVLDGIKDMPHVTANQVLSIIGVDAARRDETAARRIGRILTAAGWEKGQKKISGRNSKIWNNPDPRYKNRREVTGTLLPGHPIYDPDYKEPEE